MSSQTTIVGTQHLGFMFRLREATVSTLFKRFNLVAQELYLLILKTEIRISLGIDDRTSNIFNLTTYGIFAVGHGRNGIIQVCTFHDYNG